MRIRRAYFTSDGRQFSDRMDAVRHESYKRSSESYAIRNRIREEKTREKQRVRLAKKQEKENILRDKLITVFGESINPVVSIIVQNKSLIREILTGRR